MERYVKKCIRRGTPHCKSKLRCGVFPTGNISAWENEHNHGVEIDPHHNYHVPFDRSQLEPIIISAQLKMRSMSLCLILLKKILYSLIKKPLLQERFKVFSVT
jgi:hypothetical protein